MNYINFLLYYIHIIICIYDEIFQCIYVVCSTLFSTYIHIYYINIPHLWLKERQKSDMCFGRVWMAVGVSSKTKFTKLFYDKMF
jgi:hypothetical protein